jgi:stalled ribosome alternative rescue factor ArfA
MSKEERKKTGEELQGFLAFRKRGYWLKNKKGKGSYDRHAFNKEDDYEE